jgi:hypothetical protein
VAEAQLADGQSLRVSLPTIPAADLIAQDGEAEVLVLYAPGALNGVVIATRPVPPEPPGGETGARAPADSRIK